MRLRIINPNATEAMTAQIAAAAMSAARPGTQIEALTNSAGPASIMGHADGARAVPGLLDLIALPGADAHVIACFDDTGLAAAREISAQPVIGIGQAAMHLAALRAGRFVVVTAAEISVPVLAENVRAYGLAPVCDGVLAARVPVLELESETGRPQVMARMQQAAADAPGAAIVLGCAGMAPMLDEIAALTGRPVFDGVRAAVGLAEILAR